LVEDDRDFADSLVDLLSPLGYSVRVAGGVREAIEALSTFAAEVALVDVKLGADDGVRLIPHLKNCRPELVCLLMTAYASLDSAVDAVRSGAEDYLSKPLEPALLARKLEHALDQNEVRQRREREQRLISMGNLCAGVAHDVNNYLQLIVSELSLLGQVVRERLPEAHSALESVRVLEQAASGAADVCRRILAFAKGQLPREGSDAAEVVRSAVPVLSKLLPAGVSLQTHLPDAPLNVVLDGKQLEQILLNLVSNARHAMLGRSGSVRIELSSREPYAAALRVIDEGAGISPEVLPRIFDPYFSTKAPGEGTGLGLSVVYGMVTSLGGTVRVESQVGHGTCFELVLPLKSAEQAMAPSVPPPSAQGTERSLLIVDDFPPILRSMEKLFTSRGYRVVCATSAEGALSLIEQPTSTYVGMITDVRLPGASGVSLVEELRRRKCMIPVVLISGDTGHVAGVERLGPDFAVLSKPFSLLDLVERFEALLEAARTRVTKRPE
jgi:signal transduction histidine kinase